MIEKVVEYIGSHRSDNVERLKDFLRIRSISTEAECAGEVRKGAEWVRGLLSGCGIKAEIVETKRHPCVIGDSGPVDGKPTVLVYGHYDVQPVGDRSLWKADPFEPAEVDGALVARGSADDKGQVLTHLLAAEAWKKAAGSLPVRVKFLIEGEEEIGSPNLDAIVESRRAQLACDYVAISDTAKLDGKTPAITYGTKGMIYKQIELSGPANDLHSGAFGGTVANPGNALCAMIASFKDADNRITLPGFYDRVKPLTGEERKLIASIDFDENEYLKSLGSPSLEGEKGYTTLERRWVRPTLDVNGLFGGFMKEGSSTIIPRGVGAKVSMRLVPDQDAQTISRAFDDAIRSAAPSGVRVRIETYGVCDAYVCPLDLPALSAAAKATEAAFGRKPVFIREGGTLPILPLFKRVLGAESVMMGFSWPNCNLHGPNEFFHISDFVCGTETSARFMHELAKLSG